MNNSGTVTDPEALRDDPVATSSVSADVGRPTASALTVADREFLRRLASDGPEPNDYEPLSDLLERVFRSEGNKEADCADIRSTLTDALEVSTLQGFALRKPHGYAGDFEIIDRIYLEHRSDDQRLRRWDDYFHAQSAPRAVRNRKTYFHNLLDAKFLTCTTARVLNVACGPGRCMHEWLNKSDGCAVSFDCIDNDPNAIAHAVRVNARHEGRISYARANVLKFEPQRKYEMIWAAGICDYLDDAHVVALIKRLHAAIAAGGELILGNFSMANPSRPYMEIVGDWRLHHRSAEHLLALAQQGGVARDHAFIGAEPEGVNLFLHIG